MKPKRHTLALFVHGSIEKDFPGGDWILSLFFSVRWHHGWHKLALNSCQKTGFLNASYNTRNFIPFNYLWESFKVLEFPWTPGWKDTSLVLEGFILSSFLAYIEEQRNYLRRVEFQLDSIGGFFMADSHEQRSLFNKYDTEISTTSWGPRPCRVWVVRAWTCMLASRWELRLF